jgi:hypothetical protein
MLASTLAFGILAPEARAAAPIVKVVGSSTTVRPSSPIPAHATSAASLTAARNEFESFQILVEAPVDQALQGVRIELGTPLEQDDGTAQIPDQNVTVYREHNYNAAQRSDLEGAPGLWPDALIPERDYFYGEDRSAFPVNVPAGQRVVAWIDVLVPENQPSGSYLGSFDVTSVQGGQPQSIAEVPVNLTVHAFTLPSKSSLATMFPIQDAAQPCRAHTGSGNCSGNAERQWRLHSLYARAGLENRVSISNPWPLGQDGAPPTAAAQGLFDKYVLPLIQGTSPQDASLSSPLKPVRLGTGGNGAKLTALHAYSYRDWHCVGACPASWKSFASDPNGDGNTGDSFSGRLHLYACDEPGASGAAWDACEPYGLTNQSGLSRFVTAMAQDAKGAGHLSKIDVLIPLVNHMVGKDCCGSRFVGNQRDHQDFQDFLDPAVHNTNASPPNQVWMYTSNMSYGSDDDSAIPLWAGWPGYAIDAPALQARAMGWLSFAYRTTGELYYDTTTKLHTAWSELYEAGGNGDGTLFYPGIPDGRGVPGDANYAPPIGGTNPIPVESIRLKRIRDAREDYEYLKILEDHGDRAFGMSRFGQLFVDPGTGVFGLDTAMFSITGSSTTLTQATIEQARRDLASRIELVLPPDPEAPDTRIDSGPSGTVTSTTATFTFSAPDWPHPVDHLCSMDDGPWDTCGPTATYTGLALGSHTFRVASASAGGDIDPTPAERTWTIVEPNVTYKADGLIRRVGDNPFKGNDVYNLTGSNQTLKMTTSRGATKSFLVKVQNDGSELDSFSIVGEKKPGFVTRYYSGSTNITNPVLGGLYSTGDLQPGGTRTIKMTVKARSGAARGTIGRWKIHAVSYRAMVNHDENVRDVVGLGMTVK